MRAVCLARRLQRYVLVMNPNKRVTVWSVIQQSPKEALMLVSLAVVVVAVSFQFLRMIAEVGVH
jgi:hypothetical protein